jgi:alanyl-tRNA synthetase
MAVRLYYTDPELLDFEATISDTGKHGQLYYTVLDRTAFYPTSGGQLHDTGKLDNIEIIEVIEQAGGEIWHLSKEPGGTVGAVVRASVDRARRRRHQRQHTAQHILSQALARLHNLVTVSVHLGEEYGAIELATDSLTPDQLMEVETCAEQVILENHPVEILMVDSKDIGSLPLRKIPKRTGQIRIIKVGEFDWSACGGTHCRSTAEVGLLKLIGTERIRGHIRIKFLSGRQALEDYRIRFTVTDRMSQAMTCHVNDLPDKLDKLHSETIALRQELLRVQKEALPMLAQQLSGTAVNVGPIRFVFHRLDSYDQKLVIHLASTIAESIEGVAAIFLQGRLVIAASEASRKDAGEIVARLVDLTGLKGGGGPQQAQLGGAIEDDFPRYLEYLMNILADD